MGLLLVVPGAPLWFGLWPPRGQAPHAVHGATERSRWCRRGAVQTRDLVPFGLIDVPCLRRSVSVAIVMAVEFGSALRRARDDIVREARFQLSLITLWHRLLAFPD